MGMTRQGFGFRVSEKAIIEDASIAREIQQPSAPEARRHSTELYRLADKKLSRKPLAPLQTWFPSKQNQQCLNNLLG